jgi:hypothetical protein
MTLVGRFLTGVPKSMLGAEFFEAVHASVDDIKAGGVTEADGVLSTKG